MKRLHSARALGVLLTVLLVLALVFFVLPRPVQAQPSANWVIDIHYKDGTSESIEEPKGLFRPMQLLGLKVMYKDKELDYLEFFVKLSGVPESAIASTSVTYDAFVAGKKFDMPLKLEGKTWKARITAEDIEKVANVQSPTDVEVRISKATLVYVVKEFFGFRVIMMKAELSPVSITVKVIPTVTPPSTDVTVQSVAFDTAKESSVQVTSVTTTTYGANIKPKSTSTVPTTTVTAGTTVSTVDKSKVAYAWYDKGELVEYEGPSDATTIYCYSKVDGQWMLGGHGGPGEATVVSGGLAPKDFTDDAGLKASQLPPGYYYFDPAQGNWCYYDPRYPPEAFGYAPGGCVIYVN